MYSLKITVGECLLDSEVGRDVYKIDVTCHSRGCSLVLALFPLSSIQQTSNTFQPIKKKNALEVDTLDITLFAFLTRNIEYRKTSQRESDYGTDKMGVLEQTKD